MPTGIFSLIPFSPLLLSSLSVAVKSVQDKTSCTTLQKELLPVIYRKKPIDEKPYGTRQNDRKKRKMPLKRGINSYLKAAERKETCTDTTARRKGGGKRIRRR
ncbi:hypothetical protein [Erwinia sp. 198]|uniref:hypothetical protein n=1 Tax=Erwinia sp. 198 TaxID=2022746 RepID=UPI000F68C533|nr:hypothetical protein [Erwinia sp. 198]